MLYMLLGPCAKRLVGVAAPYHRSRPLQSSQPMPCMARGTGQAFGAIRSRTHGEFLLVVDRLSAVGHLESMLEQGGMDGMSILVRRSRVPSVAVE